MRALYHFRTPFCSKSAQILGFFAWMLLTSSCSSDPQNRPSPLTIDSGMVGDVKVKLEYSSPGVKGRKIFGHGTDFLVPFAEIWRTGANDASYITVDRFVKVDSFLLDSGSYAIFTIPDDNTWTVIFNREWNQWGSYNYNESNDVFRLDVPSKALDKRHERMKIFIEEDSLKFTWDQIGWSVPMSTFP